VADRPDPTLPASDTLLQIRDELRALRQDKERARVGAVAARLHDAGRVEIRETDT